MTVDVARLDDALRKVLGDQAQGMTMPAITYQGTTPKVVQPKPGLALNPERSAEVVRTGWLAGDPVTVPLVETHPATTPEELDRMVAELAKPAVAAPVTLRTNKGR